MVIAAVFCGYFDRDAPLASTFALWASSAALVLSSSSLHLLRLSRTPPDSPFMAA